MEEQRQVAAAAAAIAYCQEEDRVRTSTNGGSRKGTDNLIRVSNNLYGTDDEEEECDDNAGELWQQVVLFAVDKPTFICALLKHAGSGGLDPRLLLRKISPEMSIPGLRDSLGKLMHNYKVRLS